jgi:amicoumacin kinase
MEIEKCESVLDVIAKRFAVDKNNLVKLSGGYHNKVYSIAGRIIRITDSGRYDSSAIQSEIDFINSFASGGIPVSAPIPFKEGHFLERVDSSAETFYVTSFLKAPGHPVDVSHPGEWTPSLFRNWGRVLGKMHARTKQCHELFDKFDRPTWNEQWSNKFHFLSVNHQHLVRAGERLIKQIQLLPKSRDTFGLIHNDFHQGNIFIQEQQITVFDFDDCAFSWFAQDIAVAYYHAVWQNQSFNPGHPQFPYDFINYFLEGYCLENKLTRDILGQIPLFLKLREIFLFNLFHQKWDMQNLEEWQVYTLEDLYYRIENEIPYTDVLFERL